ncbi:MAG TPA: hypothetical protein VIK72_13430 [Clostridiaceae bacterium]
MNKIEAHTAMALGSKVTHRFFSYDEYIHIIDGKMFTEDGYRFEDAFDERDTIEWTDGWIIFE